MDEKRNSFEDSVKKIEEEIKTKKIKIPEHYQDMLYEETEISTRSNYSKIIEKLKKREIMPIDEEEPAIGRERTPQLELFRPRPINPTLQEKKALEKTIELYDRIIERLENYDQRISEIKKDMKEIAAATYAKQKEEGINRLNRKVEEYNRIRENSRTYKDAIEKLEEANEMLMKSRGNVDTQHEKIMEMINEAEKMLADETENIKFRLFEPNPINPTLEESYGKTTAAETYNTQEHGLEATRIRQAEEALTELGIEYKVLKGIEDYGAIKDKNNAVFVFPRSSLTDGMIKGAQIVYGNFFDLLNTENIEEQRKTWSLTLLNDNAELYFPADEELRAGNPNDKEDIKSLITTAMQYVSE